MRQAIDLRLGGPGRRHHPLLPLPGDQGGPGVREDGHIPPGQDPEWWSQGSRSLLHHSLCRPVRGRPEPEVFLFFKFAGEWRGDDFLTENVRKPFRQFLTK